MELLNKIWDMLRSPRFIAFYWSTGLAGVVGFLSIVIESIPDLGMPELATALTIAALAQITKALNNFKQNKPMGFAVRKKYDSRRNAR